MTGNIAIGDQKDREEFVKSMLGIVNEMNCGEFEANKGMSFEDGTTTSMIADMMSEWTGILR